MKNNLIDMELVARQLATTKRDLSNKEFTLQEKNLIHLSMGVAGEAGEVLDELKKYVFTGRITQEEYYENVRKEIGDLFWYLLVLCKELNLDIKTILEDNYAKVRERYIGKSEQLSALKLNRE